MGYRITRIGLFAVVVAWIQSVGGQCPDVRAFCTNYLTISPETCDSVQCQGRAGKRGPVGPKGDKGDVRSATDNNVQRRLVAMENKMLKSERMATFNFCALGMKSKGISDLSVTTSRNADALSLGHFARLGNQAVDRVSSGSWCAGSDDPGKWIKVDFGKFQPISGLILQGSPSSDSWVTSFTVSCGDSNGRFEDIVEHGTVKVFSGNTDRDGEAVNMFAEVETCRYIRVNVKRWHGRPCLRMEFLRGSCHSPNRFKFYVESAGMDDGNVCKILINGVQRAIQSRGHCVVTFDVKSQSIIARTFDTHLSTKGVTDLLNFLKSVPEYSVIAFAVMDSTNSLWWNSEISSLMEDLGAVGKTVNSSSAAVRDSWAFITQKVGSNDPRPPWVKYQHVLRYKGKATLHAAISLSAYYPSWEDTPIH